MLRTPSPMREEEEEEFPHPSSLTLDTSQKLI